ncbi:putative RNA methyltransferase [Idiomarina loihiensis]|uniref:rRNA (Guanine-N1-)-methyltransferase, putative n=1 Tax=Idiomarina loihiensis (strain ATCC BAA-735 / DSM 15497 / L2-TR) TaxID=283942 RepID=Q5QV87_IDILO|nr:methyltransferase domain-containing protein [Idiomarina loihiensis]AAV83341.1 RRNA (guanine-N1-)-methyltransferase, putative [Idiomarina loihiensis L2TR]AGM37384.1 rRNA (guanine-N(1)-)-methyltransferase [Idiomarina loihiensis GSL 199]
MPITKMSALRCPIEQSPLQLVDGSWRCENGHSYDVAKQGYVNLLPVQNKRSKDPGDSKAMVQARREFLEQGYYEPLAQVLADTVLAQGEQAVLDAGCGEGYYLRYLVEQAVQNGTDLSVAALDISKWAVQAAAKRDKRLSWMVASNNSIPLDDNSVDTILCVFGFPVEAEFKRVLKPGGRLIMVDPAGDHLKELKAIIYSEIKTKSDNLPVNSEYWSLASEQRVTFQFELNNNQAVQNLLTMTPHLYRSSAEGRERAEAHSSLQLTVDVWVRAFSFES